MLSDERKGEILRRLRLATPGPWKIYVAWWGPTQIMGMGGPVTRYKAFSHPASAQAGYNQEFVAHSWEDIRDLLLELGVEV